MLVTNITLENYRDGSVQLIGERFNIVLPAHSIGDDAVESSMPSAVLASNIARFATEVPYVAITIGSEEDDGIESANASLVYRGVIDCSANPDYPAADAGHTYIVSVGGKIGGADGTVVVAGGMVICRTDATASGDQETVGGRWSIVHGGSGGGEAVDLSSPGPIGVTTPDYGAFSLMSVNGLKQWGYADEVADDATFNLPTMTVGGFGNIFVEGNEEQAQFTVDESGNVSLQNFSDHVVANANTDGSICIGSGISNPVVIKNRLGAGKNIIVSFCYK